MAWQDLIILSQDKESHVRERAIRALGSVFPYVLDRNKSWQDLRSITKNEDSHSRKAVAEALGLAFSYIPDKDSAWQDLHNLIRDNEGYVQRVSTETLGSAFSFVPERDLAWQDFLMLARNEDNYLREGAAEALKLAFPYILDGNSAWKELIRLTQDKNAYVQETSANALNLAFPHVPDRDLAWQDLLKLFIFSKGFVRIRAAEALGTAFSYVFDKESAWKDLVYLARKDTYLIKSSPKALILAFPNVPDKNLAWQDLIELANEGNAHTRENAAEALGSVFPHVLDRDLAWQDLQMLSQDDKPDVRMYAYYNLGRISVLKATETDDRYILRRELESAVTYFEQSSREGSPYNPANFCCPFYRSYISIIFDNADESRVDDYLKEAKRAVGDSESKEELLMAVKNLARALRESQKLKIRPLDEIISDLNAYRWYCEKAAEYMTAVEDKAPWAVKLLRKCNPVIAGRIEATISEIKGKAEKLCKITSGTEYETLGVEIQSAAVSLSVDDIERTQRSSATIVSQIKDLCKLLPKDKRGLVCESVEDVLSAKDFPEKFEKLEVALEYLLAYFCSSHESYEVSLSDIVILTILPEEYNAICTKIFNIGPPPRTHLMANRYAWKFGEVHCKKYKGAYTVAVGMIGRAGTIQSALAAFEAAIIWNPFYIFLIGIAGGLSNLNKGDVVVADVIHGYEYGKIDDCFHPRDDWTFSTDQGLLNSANAYALGNEWRELIKVKPPIEVEPNVVYGEIASGDKIIDNSSDPFFEKILSRWPKVKVVEMEGAGVGTSIEHINSLHIQSKHKVRFMMIRGVSHLLRSQINEEIRGTQERDNWKPYAADTAAAFTLGLLAEGLPILPSTYKSSLENGQLSRP